MSEQLPAAPSPDQRAALATILRLLPQLIAAQQRDLQAKLRAYDRPAGERAPIDAKSLIA